MLHNALPTAGSQGCFTTPSPQRAARDASQHPPHSQGSFTTPSTQPGKLDNTLHTAREASQHPPHSGLHSTLRTVSFTTPSAQRAAREASQHPLHSGQREKLHNTLYTAGFTTPSTQRGKLHNTLRTGSQGGVGGGGLHNSQAITMTAGWGLRHCWRQRFST